MNIQELLVNQKKAVESKESAISDEIQILKYNEEMFHKIDKIFMEVTGIHIWKDYGFQSGAILGFLRSLLRLNMSDRVKVTNALGIPEYIVELAYAHIGYAPYLSNGKIISRPMNVQKTKDLVEQVYVLLDMIIPNLDDYTEEHVNEIYSRALQNAEKTKKQQELQSDREGNVDESKIEYE